MSWRAVPDWCWRQTPFGTCDRELTLRSLSGAYSVRFLPSATGAPTARHLRLATARDRERGGQAEYRTHHSQRRRRPVTLSVTPNNE